MDKKLFRKMLIAELIKIYKEMTELDEYSREVAFDEFIGYIKYEDVGEEETL